MFQFDSNLESEGLPSMELFELLTDAVRCGPGTAAWTRAVEALSATNALDASASLLAVREKLDVARDARAIESSQRLKDSVMASVAAAAREEARGIKQVIQSAPIRRRPVAPRWGASSIAMLAASAALVVVAISAIVIELMIYNTDARTQIALNNPPAGAAANVAPDNIPDGWRPIGSLHVKLDHDGALRVAGGIKRPNQTGGILQEDPLPQGQPFEVQATLSYSGASSVSPEIFITDSAAGDDAMTVGAAHDFVWTVANDRPGLRLPDGKVTGRGQVILPGQVAFITLKMRLDSTSALIQASDDTTGWSGTWSGPHQLAADKDWHIGVRFVVHGTRRDDCVAVESLHVRPF